MLRALHGECSANPASRTAIAQGLPKAARDGFSFRNLIWAHKVAEITAREVSDLGCYKFAFSVTFGLPLATIRGCRTP